jgi:D-glycero-beta-D-manno-heptose-7-phosphate kinase
MLNKDQLNKTFEAFNGKKIIIVGDVMIDAYLWGHVDRISPEAPVPIVTVEKRESRLGGAANVALNIKSLGAEPILCSVIGNDFKADEFLELLGNDKLPDRGIIKSQERITTTKFRIIGNKMQMLRVDEEVTKDLSPVEENHLMESIAKIVGNEDIKAIVMQDYNKGVLTASLIKNIVTLANKENIPVVVDPKKINFEAYKNVTLFKPNLKELKEGLNLGIDTKSIADINKAVRHLHQKQNIKMVLTTLSEDGVFISTKIAEDQYKNAHLPAHLRSISDVSGAGDTVISVATLCLALGLESEDLANISNLAGGIVCEKTGVVPIDKIRLLTESLNLIDDDQ